MSALYIRFSIALSVISFAGIAGIAVYARYIRHHRKFEDPMRRKAARKRDQYLQKQMKTRSVAIASQIFMVPLIVIILALPTGSKMRWLTIYLLIYAVIAAGMTYWVIRNRNKFRRSLLDDEFRICPNCFYSLRGSPDAGRCPECGYDYTIETLKEEWCHTLHVKPEE